MFGLWGKKVIGIELTDDQLKLVQISKKRRQSIVTHYAVENIPAGLIQNGMIQNVDKLRQILKTVKRQLKIGHRKINLAINSPNILLRPLQMPKVDKKLLAKAIEMEITNNIQLPFQQFTYDYALIPERETTSEFETEGSKQELMLVIASKEMLESYVALFKTVNFEVVNIDLAPISFLRILELEHKNSMEQLFIGINLHPHFAEISIFSDTVLRLSRNVSFNLQSYVIADQLEHSIDNTETYNYEAYSSDLVREVERILNFFRYTLNHREQQLDKIVLTGNLPNNTEQIVNALSTYFQVPTSIMTADHVNVHGKIRRGYAVLAPMLTIPMGLALKDVRA